MGDLCLNNNQLCIAITKKGTCQYRARYGPYCGIHKSHLVHTNIPTKEVKMVNVSQEVGNISVQKKMPKLGSIEPIDIGERDLSHMNMRHSLNGIDFDIVKSGLQKSIRRCKLPEALSYAIEGDFFSVVEKDKAKGNRTNLMNRIRIILVEDLFDWRVIMRVCPWFDSWIRTRKTNQSRKYLLSIVRVLADAKKIRLTTDLKVFMFREAYRKSLGNKYDDIFNQWNDYGKSSSALSRFSHLLGKGNPNCLYWYQQLVDSGSVDSIWASILNVAEHKNAKIMKVLNALAELKEQLGKTHKEKFVYDMSAISLVLFNDRIDWDSELDLPDLMSNDQTEQLYLDHWNRWTSENLPYGAAGWLPAEIVIDRHTGKGKRRGKTALDFATVGSVVVNEDKNFYFPVLREIYMEKKIAESKDQKYDIDPLDINQPTNPWNSEYMMSEQTPE